MKTIIELKKGCGEIESLGRSPCQEGNLCDECEAKLQTLQEVCEEMKKVFKREIELQTVGTDTIDKIEELLKKFQGEEK